MGIGGKCKDNINMADFEEYVCNLCTLILRRRLRGLRVRRMWSRAWLQMRRTRSFYINTLLQELRAEDVDKYKNYMRISKETFNMLLEKVRLYIKKQDTKMRQSISAEERLDVTLRFLATKSMRSFTNSFVQLHFDILVELVCLLFPHHIYHVLLFTKYLNDLDSKNHSDWLVPIKVHQSF
jgi:hypothetical protein